MQTEETTAEREAVALREAKKLERRVAMAQFKALHAVDPARAKEEARLWFERQAGEQDPGAADDSFHRRKLSESDPDRKNKAAKALQKSEADAGRAQNASREVVKEWKKRNPNKVKKLSKLYRERQKT